MTKKIRIVEEIFEELHMSGVVRNSGQFSEQYLNCNPNAYNFLKYMDKDITTEKKLVLYRKLSEMKKYFSSERRSYANACMNLIAEDVNERFNLKLKTFI